MNELHELIRNNGKIIDFYLAREEMDDPFEKNVSVTLINPIPVKGLVTDLTTSKVQWTMVGIVTNKAKEIIIESRYKDLLEQSQKIKIDNEYYVGYRQNGQLQYRIEGSYIRAYIYIKKT